jgi:O-acetylhomoserine/O-acetylserine sulfhydrylase-like pyridoxal-dependent enzyme
VRDDKGEIYTVRYDSINAMLLNEFLKEHRKVEELRASDAEQKKEIAALRRQLHEQAEAVRRVSERVEIAAASKQVIADQR